MHPPCALLGAVGDCRDSVETIVAQSHALPRPPESPDMKKGKVRCIDTYIFCPPLLKGCFYVYG